MGSCWIESHYGLVEHKKVREVAKFLDIEPVLVIGHLHCFWHNVIQFREDGNISSWNIADICYYSKWPGDPERFYNALKDRFIDEKDGKKYVHNWLEYAYKYLRSKYHNHNPKKLKAIENSYKIKGTPKGQPKGQIPKCPQGQPKGRLPTNQPTNQPTINSSEPLKKDSKPENTDEKEPEYLKDSEGKTIAIPLRDTANPEWPIPSVKYGEWLLSFPHLDVLKVLIFIRQYFRDKPSKRKTVRGIPSCITSWLNREMDKPYSRYRKQDTDNGPEGGQNGFI